MKLGEVAAGVNGEVGAGIGGLINERPIEPRQQLYSVVGAVLRDGWTHCGDRENETRQKSETSIHTASEQADTTAMDHENRF
jgi:hypothetical protein